MKNNPRDKRTLDEILGNFKKDMNIFEDFNSDSPEDDKEDDDETEEKSKVDDDFDFDKDDEDETEEKSKQEPEIDFELKEDDDFDFEDNEKEDKSKDDDFNFDDIKDDDEKCKKEDDDEDEIISFSLDTGAKEKDEDEDELKISESEEIGDDFKDLEINVDEPVEDVEEIDSKQALEDTKTKVYDQSGKKFDRIKKILARLVLDVKNASGEDIVDYSTKLAQMIDLIILPLDPRRMLIKPFRGSQEEPEIVSFNKFLQNDNMSLKKLYQECSRFSNYVSDIWYNELGYYPEEKERGFAENMFDELVALLIAHVKKPSNPWEYIRYMSYIVSEVALDFTKNGVVNKIQNAISNKEAQDDLLRLKEVVMKIKTTNGYVLQNMLDSTK